MMRTAFLTVALWAVLCASASAVVNVNVFAVPASEGTGRISAFCDGNACASPSTLTLERGSTVIATSHKDAFNIDRMSASPQAGDKLRLVVQGSQRALLTYDGPPTVTDPCGRVGEITFAGSNPGGNSAFVTAFVGDHQASVTSANGLYTAKAPEVIAASDSFTVSSLYAAAGGNGMRSEWTQRACPPPPPEVTPTPTPTATPAVTATPTPTATPAVTASPTPTPSATARPSSTSAARPSSTTTATPTFTAAEPCSIAALDARSQFRGILKSAVTGLRKTRLRAFAKRRGVLLTKVLACEAGRITAAVVLAGKRKVVLAKGALSLRSPAAGRFSVRLRPTKTGRRRFGTARRLRVRVTARVLDPGGKVATYSKVLILKR
jgi:hypothetical protein